MCLCSSGSLGRFLDWGYGKTVCDWEWQLRIVLNGLETTSRSIQVSQCTNCQQPVGCVAFGMVSCSAGSSFQWNIQSVFPTVGYKTFSRMCVFAAAHQGCSPQCNLFTKEKAEVLEMHLWQGFPGAEWTGWAPQNTGVQLGAPTSQLMGS